LTSCSSRAISSARVASPIPPSRGRACH
jgi:hypothetical protein